MVKTILFRKRILLAIILSALFLYIAFRSFDPGKIVQALGQIQPIYFIPIFLLIFVTMLVHALRWKHIINKIKKIKTSRLFEAMMISHFTNIVLPINIGTLLGLLISLASIGGFIGSIVYGWWLDRFALKRMLYWLVWANFAITLVYLLVKSPTTAIVIYLVGGFIGYITLIHCMKLIVGVCPKKAEATTFALVTSVVNLGGSVLAPILGGQLFKVIGLAPLIVLSAFAGLLALLVLPKIK